MSAYEPHKRMIAGELVEIPRGAVVASERFLSTRWEWSRSKVRSFLSVLSSDGMVKIEAGKKDQQNTTIFLCNYEKHNPQKDQQKTTKEPVKDQSKTSEEPLKDQIEERKEGKDVQDGKERKESIQRKSARFVPPSEEEAMEFGKELGMPKEQTFAFLDFYASKGWLVGKVPMKDWKAAQRGWYRRQEAFGGSAINGKPPAEKPKTIGVDFTLDAEDLARKEKYLAENRAAREREKLEKEKGNL